MMLSIPPFRFGVIVMFLQYITWSFATFSLYFYSIATSKVTTFSPPPRAHVVGLWIRHYAELRLWVYFFFLWMMISITFFICAGTPHHRLFVQEITVIPVVLWTQTRATLTVTLCVSVHVTCRVSWPAVVWRVEVNVARVLCFLSPP